ncbi:MAG: hypothetical protein GY700_14260, partial [Propionibacteriaceae bacterium]|nr:hypothetical protein [Propionibacteriaceae bacterium]
TLNVDCTGAASIDAVGASNITVDTGNLTVNTTTSGSLILDGVALVDLNAGANLDIDVTGDTTIDSTGVVSIDGVGASNLTTDTGDLTLSTSTSGNVDITAADDINIAAAGSDVDIDSATLTVDCTGAASIDAVGASNLTTDTGNLTVSTTTSGDIIADSAANIQLAPASGSAIQMQDGADNTRITVVDSSGITTGNTRTLAMCDADLSLTNVRKTSWTMAALGPWAIDGDAVMTNGAGMCGADPTTTAAIAAMAVCYDSNNTQYNLLSVSGAGTDYTANWQLFTDTKNDGDYVAFGADAPFCEVAFDMSATVMTYTGDGVKWQYSQGSAAWADLTVAYDGTDATAQDGLRAFGRDGALSFVPPADWATETVNGQLGYFIRSI